MTTTVLKDGRELLLRPAEESDTEQLVAYLNLVGGESNFLTYGENGFRFTAGEERLFLRDHGKNQANLFLVGLVGGELICSASLTAESKERIAHNCELGITVKKEYWHLGAASALLTELIRFARESGALKAIHLDVYANNERAIRLYEKFGFRRVGLLKNYFRVGGSYYDDVVMDLYL